MLFEKYAQRIEYLHNLILRESTGRPGELARKLGISERMLYRYLEALRDVGHQIEFCQHKKSYVYSKN